MKTTVALTLMSFALCALHPTPAQAQGSTGNGGDAIIVDGKYCVLDLAEAGICKKIDAGFEKEYAEFNKALAAKQIDHPSLYKLLYVNLAEFDALPFSVDVKNALRFLLYRMSAADQATFRMVLLGFHWSFTDLDLINIGDEDTFIDTLKYPLQQAAIRSKNTIQVSSPIFDQLSLANQLSLISHEVLYALVKPVLKGGKRVQLSRTARDLNGRWFETFTKGKTPEWGFTRWLDGIGWQTDVATGKQLFNYVLPAEYGPIGIPYIGPIYGGGKGTRYYVPFQTVIYSTSGYDGKHDPNEILKNKVGTFESYFALQGEENSTHLFPTPEILQRYTQTDLGEDACKKLIAQGQHLGAIGVLQRYSDMKFSHLDDSDAYAVNFTAAKLHGTSKWEIWADNTIQSEEFEFKNLKECKAHLIAAYLNLRHSGRYYYEGISWDD